MGEDAGRVDPDRSFDDSVGPGSWPTRWILLTGDRNLVAAGVLVGVFVVTAALLAVGLIDVSDPGPLTRAFAALVGGNLTLITIVVSINQLVLSREFGTPAELEEEIGEMMDYRRRAEETVGTAVSPTTPDSFLDLLVGAVRDHALALREETGDVGDVGRLHVEVEEFVETLLAQTEWTTDTIEDSPAEAFSALIAILGVDFTDDMHTARYLRATYGDELPVEAIRSLDELVRLFEYLGVLRQYLETLYLQRELALFSRRLFYVGLPAVVVSFLTNWVYGPLAGTTVDGLALKVLVTLAAVVAFTPLAFVFAYIVRIATVTRLTAALMPFRIRKGRD